MRRPCQSALLFFAPDVTPFMISQEILRLMRCPACHHADLQLTARRHPSLECVKCRHTYPIVDGILDMVLPEEVPSPGQYRTEGLFNFIAGFYDVVAPAMSMAIWRCGPMHWVDSENRALGRANGGVYLKAPLGTGLVLDRVLAPYHEVTILGVDRSWKMLEQAAKRFEKLKTHHTLQLIRADYENLPFRPNAVDAIQSVNGIQAFPKRVEALKEFKRCVRHGGYLSGSSLIRGQEALADTTLARLERYGVYPMLRTAEFLLRDFQHAKLRQIEFETHGAVMFFAGEVLKSRKKPTPRGDTSA